MKNTFLLMIILTAITNADIKYIKLYHSSYVFKIDGVSEKNGTSSKALEKAIKAPITMTYEKAITRYSGCSNFDVLGMSFGGSNYSPLKIMIDCKDELQKETKDTLK